MNSSKIFSKKVQTILLSVGMVLYSLMPGVASAQSNWVPPTGPPPNNNAPRPFHQGLTGQAKYYSGPFANATLGAFGIFAEALVGTYGIFDGPGTIANRYCFGDVSTYSDFPGNVNSLNCISEDDWLTLNFLINNGDGEGDLLPDGEFGKQLLYWDLGESTWLPMPTTFANVTDNSATISLLSDSNRIASFLVRGVTELLNGSGGQVRVDTEGVTIDTGSYEGDFFLRLGTGNQPIGSVPVVLDALGRMGWSTEFSGGNLPDGGPGSTLFYNSQTQQWEASNIVRSEQGAPSQSGDKLFIGNQTTPMVLDLFGQLVYRNQNDPTDPNYTVGKALIGGPNGAVQWGELSGLPTGPDDDGAVLLAWNGNTQQWETGNSPLRVLHNQGTFQNESGVFETRPRGSYFIGPVAIEVGETDAVQMSPNIPAAFARFPLAQGSNNVLSYQNSKLGQIIAGGGLGQGQTNILQSGSVVVNSPLIVSTIPYASDGAENLGLVRPLCYEILFGSNSNPNPQNWSGLLVDCDSTAPGVESGSLVAVGSRFPGQAGLNWAAQRAINIEPVEKENNRVRYLWNKPPLVSSVSLIACAGGGGGGGGGGGKPGNSSQRPSGGGGSGGSEGSCVEQTVNVNNVVAIEMLVGDGGEGGSRGIHWFDSGTNNSGYVPSQNGSNGGQTIVRFWENDNDFTFITVSGGIGGGRGFFHGESPTFGSRAAGGRSGVLTRDSITQSDGFDVNEEYISYNGGTGTFEVNCEGTPEACAQPIPSIEDSFTTLGWVTAISGGIANTNNFASANGGRGGRGRQLSNTPIGLSNIGDGSMVTAPSYPGSFSGNAGNWGGGGGGGTGFTVATFGNPNNFPGWLNVSGNSNCANSPGTLCAPGGFGGRGGPGFVQLSW
jgi:hypothetical protein